MKKIKNIAAAKRVQQERSKRRSTKAERKIRVAKRHLRLLQVNNIITKAYKKFAEQREKIIQEKLSENK